jgi:mannose/cellobiose epimerase-like protein (N-acyl-D-glucosamine 2-epimerase family)
VTRHRDTEWLAGEVGRILDFYHPGCVDDANGGFVAQLDPDTGAMYDAASKHLVATSRFTANFALGARYGGPDGCADLAAEGVRFLREAHYDAEADGYDWLLDGREPVDRRRVCYGHAFVLLAFARAADADVDGAAAALADAADLLLDRFYDADAGRCRSEYAPDWSDPADYRGQNANMHACEAMLAAHAATGDDRYADVAERIARAICVDLAAETDGLLWEHYAADWSHDFAYNRDRPADTFRPWGYQPGHHAEWAKLLAILDRRDVGADWALDRARELFDAAVEFGWTDDGGFVYTFDRDGAPVVADRYGWPVAEAIGAAAALHERTGDDRYLRWYDRLWTYAEDVLVASGPGATRNWYARCTPGGEPYPVDDGPEVEPGYHPIGACVEAIRSFG